MATFGASWSGKTFNTLACSIQADPLMTALLWARLSDIVNLAVLSVKPWLAVALCVLADALSAAGGLARALDSNAAPNTFEPRITVTRSMPAYSTPAAVPGSRARQRNPRRAERPAISWIALALPSKAVAMPVAVLWATGADGLLTGLAVELREAEAEGSVADAAH